MASSYVTQNKTSSVNSDQITLNEIFSNSEHVPILHNSSIIALTNC